MGTRNSALKGPGEELGHQLISSGHSGRRVLWRSQGQLPSLERTVGSVWGQGPGNQPRRGVPHNLATVRLTQPVSSDLKHFSSGKQRVLYLHRPSVRATEEVELGSAPPTPRFRLPTRSDPGFSGSQDPGSGSQHRLSHPPLGSGQPELTRVTSGPVPRGARLRKRNVPPSLRQTERVLAGFRFGFLNSDPVGVARGRMTALCSS